MKRGLFLIAAMILLTACQRTPDEQAVVQKDEAAMIALAKSGEPYLGDPAQLNAPQRVEGAYQSEKGFLTVKVDAVVELPSQPLSIVRLTPTTFSSDDAQRCAEVLMDKNCFVEDASYTKAMYAHEAERLKDAIAHWEEYGNILFDNYESAYDAEEKLGELYRLMAQAPETKEKIAPSFELLKQNSADPDATYISLYAMPDDATLSSFDVFNVPAFGECSMTYTRDMQRSISPSSREVGDVSDLLTISPDEALALAQNALHEMGYEDFISSGIHPVVQYYGNFFPVDYVEKWGFYQCMFTRSVGEVPLTYTNQEYIFNPDVYAIQWQAERIVFLIDDEGVFSFSYIGPYETGQIEADACALLPFDEIWNTFEKRILLVNNLADQMKYPQEYRITTVRLGLMSVRAQDKADGIIIPVWDFMGTLNTSVGETDTNGLRSFLTINAVDGSIINRGDGY
ncbi:MAG: DUF6034 family protein [Clostridia bacterium]|nr:DUF6034 family protein [Clostridia bacterium]